MGRTPSKRCRRCSSLWRLILPYRRKADSPPVEGKSKVAKGEMHGKVVLITGGSSGIGLATAMRFAREGAAIALLARDQARLRAAARMVARVAEAEPLPIACDVTCENEVISAFDETLSRLGRL